MALVEFSQWLKRKPAGPKPKKRLPRMSARRKVESREYTEKRKAFLKAHPLCQAWPVIVSHAPPETLGDLPPLHAAAPLSVEIHHRCKRGKNYLDESTWLAVSRFSHRWIEDHKKEARKLGLLK